MFIETPFECQSSKYDSGQNKCNTRLKVPSDSKEVKYYGSSEEDEVTFDGRIGKALRRM